MASSDRERAEAYAALWRVWRDAGVNPGHHRAWQRRLRTEWPMLAHLLDTMPEPGPARRPPPDTSWIREEDAGAPVRRLARGTGQTKCNVCGGPVGSLGIVLGRWFPCGHGAHPENRTQRRP